MTPQSSSTESSHPVSATESSPEKPAHQGPVDLGEIEDDVEEKEDTSSLEHVDIQEDEKESSSINASTSERDAAPSSPTPVKQEPVLSPPTILTPQPALRRRINVDDVTATPTVSNRSDTLSTTSSTSPDTDTTTAATPSNSINGTINDSMNQLQEGWNEILPTLDERIGRPSRKALHNFFYTQQDTANTTSAANQRGSTSNPETPSSSNNNDDQPPNDSLQQQQQPPLDLRAMQEEEDQKWMTNFWKWYDDLIILSLFGFLGIVFRLAAANWFKVFDDVFNASSALFTNLPLNCLSCFLLGMLGSGNDLFEIISTRKTSSSNNNNNNYASLQQQRQEQQESLSLADTADDDEASYRLDSPDGLRHRRGRNPLRAWLASTARQPVAAEDELREVQLLALERRIRASPCLILFPVKKEEMDVMEHYFDDGGQQQQEQRQAQQPQRSSLYDLSLTVEEGLPRVESADEDEETDDKASSEDGSEHKDEEEPPAPLEISSPIDPAPRRAPRRVTINGRAPVPMASPALHADATAEGQGLDQFINGVSANIQGVSTNISTNFSRFNRINLADGWDNGTSARAMSDDLLLGLRTGFCGALSSFTSWNSSMVNLLRSRHFGEAFVGYIIGLQLPIVSYRFGQHAAMYLFIWRCRWEIRRDEARGYGLRVRLDDDSDEDEDFHDEIVSGEENGSPTSITRPASKSPGGTVEPEESAERDTPSVRAIATAIFVMCIVTMITSITFFKDPGQQQIAISLLFSPFGVLTRWKLSKFNNWRPGFPLGTFSCNMLACALSGSLGSLLAGNPGPEESIVLVAMISGFGGSLSSLAAFVVEILARIDPIIFKYSGFTYAILTIWWGFVIGFVSRASKDWADEI